MDKGFESRECFFILLLILIPFCSYMNSLDGTFVFDDARIYTNPAVRLETFSVPGLIHAVKSMEPSSRPVANLTFILNYLADGFDTRGYHLVNLCIHIGAGILLYFFIKTTLALPTLFNKDYQKDWIAFAGALIWLVHPIQSQAVTYIIQRMTSLSALFFILSLLLYARSRTTRSYKQKGLLIGGCIMAGLLSLGCKETAVTLPLFILLYEWFFFQHLRTQWLMNNKKYLIGIGCFLVLSCFLFLGSNPWGAIVSGYASRNFSLMERILTESRVILFYLGLLLFPHPGRLSNEHDFVLSTSLFNPISTLFSIAALLFLLGFTLISAKKYRLGAFCILWFLGNHLIEGTIIPVELVFEHRNYLPSMLLVPFGIMTVSNIIENRRILFLLFSIPVAVFSYWTYQRNFVWQNNFSLWSDAVEKAPNSARANNNYGIQLEKTGMTDKALLHYQKTIQLDPEYTAAHYNLAGIFMQLGDVSKAIHHYRQALLLEPGEVDIQMNLADALLHQGNFAEARIHYLKVLERDPGNVDAKVKIQGINWKLRNFRDRKGFD